MSRSRISLVSLCAGLGFLVGYLSAYLLGLPLLRYMPIEHAWSWSTTAGSISMGYFGLLLYGAGASVTAMLAGFWLPRRQSVYSGLTIASAAIAILGMLASLVKEGLHWF